MSNNLFKLEMFSNVSPKIFGLQVPQKTDGTKYSQRLVVFMFSFRAFQPQPN